MPLEFSESGYTEVYRGGTLVSRHRAEREAIESVLRDAENTGALAYEIRRPVIVVTIKPKAAPVVGAINGSGQLAP